MITTAAKHPCGPTRPPDDAAGQIARILAGFAARNPVPGLAVSVFDSTTIVAELGLGIRALDSPGDAMTDRTLFRLISLTKMLTALAAVRLADAGRLALDEPIRELFPASAGLPVPIQAVTVRHLLSHTSGLIRGELDLDVGGRDPDGLVEYTLTAGIHTPLIAGPGVVYSYSDQGFSLVGYLIERVTGRRFAAAVRELVFEPLGMQSACFEPLIAMTYPLSQQHIYQRPRGLVQHHRFAEATRIHPCAGAFCSVHDLALLGMLHLNDGLAPGPGGRLLSAAAVREMRTPQTDIGLDIDLRYGLGAYVGPRYGGHPAHGHEGYLFGTWAKLVLVPGLRLGVAWCDNCGPIPAVVAERYRAINEILATLSGAEPDWSRPACDAADGDLGWPVSYLGRYRPHAGRPVDVSARGDALHITDGRVTVPLVRHHGPVFIARPGAPVPARPPWEPHAGSNRCCVRFVTPADGRTSHLTLNGIAYRRTDRMR